MQSTINISKYKIRWLALLLACVWLATHQAFASQLFGPPVLLTLAPGSSGPRSIALGDLNRDGNLDIVVASQNGILNVFLGNADGSFRSPTPYATGASTIAGLTDCNADGKLDVVAHTPGGYVQVLLGNGDGTLQAPVTSSVPVNGFGAVVVGDLDGDGLPDVASTFFYQSPRARDHEAWTFVSLGNGDGSFGSPRRVLITTDLSAGDLGIADFNGDGRLDLAVVAWSHGRVDILLGNGDGTFQKSGSFHVGTQYQHTMATADINGDGRVDLAVPTVSPLKVAYGNGDGTFPKPVSLITSDSRNPKQVAVADFNGDGRADMVLAWGAADSIEVYVQTPTGTFKKQFYSGLVGPVSVATGDLDHDGLADVVVADVDANDVAVFLTKSRQ